MSIVEKFYAMEYGTALEDPKEAVQWLERHHRRFDEFIGGAWVKPISGEYQTTSDPSTGDTIVVRAAPGSQVIVYSEDHSGGVSLSGVGAAGPSK